MPQLGLEVTEGLVVEILVEPGAAVSEGDPLIVLATDKADTEVHAPVGGVVRKISVAIDETVPVGAVLMAVADSADEPLGSEEAPGAEPEPPSPGSATAAASEVESPDAAAPAPRRRVAPIARRAAADLGVDLDRVEGTGPRGRVTIGDVERAASHVPAAPTPAVQ